MRVALGTDAEFADLVLHDDLHRQEPLGRGIDAGHPVWDDPAQDWEAYDLVVIRSTWDYTERRADYVRWAHAVPRLENSARIVEWNTDKTYLRELAELHAVPVVPTAWVTEPASLGVLVKEAGWGEVVVKPTVSAGARDTLKCHGTGLYEG